MNFEAFLDQFISVERSSHHKSMRLKSCILKNQPIKWNEFPETIFIIVVTKDLRT